MKVVVRVKHQGVYKMVGKVFPVGDRSILLHEAGQGSQYHRNLDSPGGLDLCVLQWAAAVGVQEVHHWDRMAKALYVAPTGRVLQLGVVQASGGRKRVYLPMAAWEVRGGVDYNVPWIKDFKDLDPDADKAQQGALLL